MGDTFYRTSQDENPVNRALVINQPSVNQPKNHFNTAAEQNDSGDAACKPDDFVDSIAADNKENFSDTEPEEPLTMNSIEDPDGVPACGHDAAQVVPERSLTATAPYIDVVVEGKSTLISKHLLCSQSSFFDRALNGSFREAHDNRIILEEPYELFQIFHTWLLEGKLDFVKPDSNASVDDLVEQRQLALLETYVFADRLGIPKLNDDALLQLDKILRPSGRPGRASVDCIYNASEFLPESSGLWQYLIALEKDANRCRSPRRALADLVDLPNSFISKVLESTADNSEVYVRIKNQPFNLFSLSKHVCDYGGYGKVEQLRKWGVICMKMGISLSFQSKIFLQVRDAYAYWLAPFDEEFSSEERLLLESKCSRPFVKQFFQAPVASTVGAMARLQIRN
ncbi:unnamed protein product [Aureobasidium mustum]|uniref:BTB domain-containing protein n=1 Tax=Aureobasidium mustum TaxID=2773714 RepID=A0A9N8JMP4_9PEZI|nr:unnamed protein product [Aureobasidium mustum]